MTHFVCEVVMPPPTEGQTIKQCVETVLAPLSEYNEDGEYSNVNLYDWWQIGGRYSGNKITAGLDKEKLELFHNELDNMELYVSGIIAGKHDLSTKEQQDLVDKVWRKYFPNSVDVCPLFDHYPFKNMDSYDTCTVQFIPLELKAYCVVISLADYDPNHLVQKDFWNGLNIERTTFDGNVLSTIISYNRMIEERYKCEWCEKNKVRPDWIAVTVDCHR